MARKRTDIHRPSSDDFDPQLYTDFGYFDLQTPEMRIVGVDGQGRAIVDRTPDVLLWYKQTPKLEARGIKRAEHNDLATCGHCGAHIRYAVIMVRGKEWIFVGEQCLGNRFPLSAAEFQRVRKEAAKRAELTKTGETHRANLAKAVEYDPRLAILADSDACGNNSFLSDLSFKLKKYELSERQLAAAVRSIERDETWKAKREAQRAASIDAPEGKQEVAGEIVSIKEHQSQFGTSWKMTVRDDRGFTVWCTVPAALESRWDYDAETGKYTEVGGVDKGDRVAFSATLTRSDKDSTFAFAKRPTKARKLEASGQLVTA